MCKIKIENVEYEENIKDGKARHKFDVTVNGEADRYAKIFWYEKTDRPYGAVSEADTWTELFNLANRNENNLFSKALANLNYAKTQEKNETTKFEFTIQDIPEVSTSIEDGRTLEIVVLVNFKEDEAYMVCCRQKILVENEAVISHSFEVTDAIQLNDKEDSYTLIDKVADFLEKNHNFKLDRLLNGYHGTLEYKDR